MDQISRDPEDLVRQCIGNNHQYPDGLMLFLGTMFTPSKDRSLKGKGFTHQTGDIVKISTPKLGTLVNEVNFCHMIKPWDFGICSLMKNLSLRGLI